MNQIKYRTESDQSTIDVDENVTAIYHDGVELLARIAKLESHISQTDELLKEVQNVQKTNVKIHETNMVNNAKRRLVERGFAVFALLSLLVLTCMEGFDIDMARNTVGSLDRMEEKVDSLVAMGHSLEKTMGIKVGDTVSVAIKKDSQILQMSENVGSKENPRIRGRVLARTDNQYIISHTLNDGTQILKERSAETPTQVLPDYTNGAYGSGH